MDFFYDESHWIPRFAIALAFEWRANLLYILAVEEAIAY
jgi:hypothetical protein